VGVWRLLVQGHSWSLVAGGRARPGPGVHLSRRSAPAYRQDAGCACGASHLLRVRQLTPQQGACCASCLALAPLMKLQGCC
jgi:hypothetical protein